MKMKLKSKKVIHKSKSIIKKIFNFNKLYQYLIIFLIVAIIIGVIFYLTLKLSDKEILSNNIKNFFTIPESINYLNNLKDAILNNCFNVIIIWLLGISAFGIIIVLILSFMETFTLGITLSSIVNTFGFKGFIISLCYLFPSKIISLINLFIISLHAFKFSYQIIQKLFFKKEINLNESMKKYLKILIICLIITIIYSILETFIDPFFLKIANLFF